NVSRASSTGPASVAYSTSDGTAHAPGDYAAKSGTVSFASGETTKPVTVNVVGDTTDEPDETFNVTLAPTGLDSCAGGDCVGVGPIVDDDGPDVRILNASPVAEGNTGTTTLTFLLHLDSASPDPITVNYATADGTATTADGDYVAKSGFVTFAANDTADKSITVTVNGDTKDENNETVLVNLSSASGASIADGQADGTITNDDTAPTVKVDAPPAVLESAGTVNVPVTLSAASGKT